MSFLRVTLFMEFRGFGASETYYSAADLDPALESDWVHNLTNARMDCAPTDCSLMAVRMSDALRTRESQLIIPPGGLSLHGNTVLIPGQGTFNPAAESTRAPILYRDALQVRVRYDTIRFTSRYMTPVPRIVTYAEPLTYQPAMSGPWVAVFTNFRNYVLARPGSGSPVACAIRARVPIPLAPPPPTPDPYRILRWRQMSAAPSYLGVVMLSTSVVGWAVGDKVHVYNTRIRSPQWAQGARLPSLNGNWFIDGVDVDQPALGQSTIWLRGTAGIDPLLIKNLGRAFKVSYGIYPMQSFEGIRVVPHKRGRPSTLPRGRRLTRVSLDP